MKSFLKIVFASLLALVLFTVIGLLVLAFVIGKATATEKPDIGSKGILVIDLSVAYREQSQENPLTSLFSNAENIPGLNDLIRMVRYAAADTAIRGLYIKANGNSNGYAASEELRQAIVDFKKSRKFVVAYGEVMSQKAYYVANAADQVFVHPKGGLEWTGLASTAIFFKGLLDKLEIEPQIFYAGKFKSATEPFRVTQMTDANRLQTTVLLDDLYQGLLLNTAQARQLDTAGLRALANTGAVQTASDALKFHLVDGLKYDDEVKSLLFGLLHEKEVEKINFIFPGKYIKALDNEPLDLHNRVAVVYAEGDITGGNGQDGEIGSDRYRSLIRKLRMDKDIKAIVFRVNSPGGSALASDVIWRELVLAKKQKPVIVSMGNLAASGGYYISCMGDSIFADPGTLTGSIGVFSIIPNLQGFFNHKLGITFDHVQTGPFASGGESGRPLTPMEKGFIQADIDSIYLTFKTRVAESRKKTVEYIDSIAQGRVWTGKRAIGLGLVDKIGTLQDAIDCAARMAKTKEYSLKEFPEKKSMIEQIIGGSVNHTVKARLLKEEMGTEEYGLLQRLKSVKAWVGIPQSRMPFELVVN